MKIINLNGYAKNSFLN